ncbi:hypothetical protein GGR57DRAFT_471409 [Xylariaceae sp. FL1272]|nr:hypothetical protein GGR57DRAFT_471409 [Xylariaceae sp. FL1272]
MLISICKKTVDFGACRQCRTNMTVPIGAAPNLMGLGRTGRIIILVKSLHAGMERVTHHKVGVFSFSAILSLESLVNTHLFAFRDIVVWPKFFVFIIVMAITGGKIAVLPSTANPERSARNW